MSTASNIAPHLGYLRRFARVLTGSQSAGDAYVTATLEALLADPSILPRQLPPRVALYKIFLALWSSADLSPIRAFPVDVGSAVDRNLEALTPTSRQAFVLRAVEGFSLDDTASILERTRAQTEDLIGLAGREISAQVATRVLIIEDEPIIAMEIEAIVTDLGHQVLGVARTLREAMALVGGAEPGLVLADIQLADGSSGLDAVNEILRATELPVVFITAFPERLLTGDKPEPAFLITKPYQAEAVKAAISQALFFDRRASRKALRGTAATTS